MTFAIVPALILHYRSVSFRSDYALLIIYDDDFQARAAVNIVTGRVTLPSKENMQADTYKWEQHLASELIPIRKYHIISGYVKQYFSEIAHLGQLKPVPKVVFEMFSKCNMFREKELATYRKRVFTIIDSQTFKYY